MKCSQRAPAKSEAKIYRGNRDLIQKRNPLRSHREMVERSGSFFCANIYFPHSRGDATGDGVMDTWLDG